MWWQQEEYASYLLRAFTTVMLLTSMVPSLHRAVQWWWHKPVKALLPQVLASLETNSEPVTHL
jgi:hypothetical protein